MEETCLEEKKTFLPEEQQVQGRYPLNQPFSTHAPWRICVLQTARRCAAGAEAGPGFAHAESEVSSHHSEKQACRCLQGVLDARKSALLSPSTKLAPADPLLPCGTFPTPLCRKQYGTENPQKTCLDSAAQGRPSAVTTCLSFLRQQR